MEEKGPLTQEEKGKGRHLGVVNGKGGDSQHRILLTAN